MMVPLSFLLALPLFATALALTFEPWRTLRPHWLVGFLGAFAIFLLLTGTRYGYGVTEIGHVQSYLAILIPPLGLLGFRNPAPSARLAIHLLPLLGLLIVEAIALPLRDAYLAAVTLGYAALLARAGLRAGETLSWAPMRHMPALSLGLWVSVGMLVLSGLTDAVVAWDLLRSGGQNIPAIVGLTTLVATGCGALCALILWRSSLSVPQDRPTNDDDRTVAALGDMLEDTEIYRDPDLTLRRMARRVAMPERQLSSAVNRVTGGNLSQFVNRHRIEAAQRDLLDPAIPVTTVMLQSGFVTKSNFNREFKRVTGETPTAWRRANAPKG